MTLSPAPTTHAYSAYRPEIDGLRAVAILLVAVFHFKLLPLGDAGFIGVDIFFVISGYLITGLLMRDLEQGRMSLGRFYLARLRRLMPALLATLVLYLAVAMVLFLPARLEELARETFLTLAYVINIYLWQTIDYFVLEADTVPLLHMWSLAIEEQFYLFYPILLALVFRLDRRAVLPLLLIATGASFALGVWGSVDHAKASFYLLPTRAWELGAGAVLALTPLRLNGPLAAIAGLLGVGLIVVAISLHTPVTPFPGWFAALPVGGAVLLILAGPGTPTGWVLSLRPMLWIGWISYPFYLVHWPIIQVMKDAFPDATLWFRWAGFAGAIVLAWAIWRFIETPIRTGAILQKPRQLLAGFGSVTVALGAVALGALLTQGIPDRLPTQAREILTYTQDRPAMFNYCKFWYTFKNYAPCKLGAKDTAPSVVVIGDSHAQGLAPAVENWLKEAGRSGELWYALACMPVPDAGRDCGQFPRNAIDRIRSDPNIDHVLLVSQWRHDPYIYGGVYLQGAKADAALEAALTQTLNDLAAPGRTIVLVDPMYTAPASIPERMAQNLYFGRNLPIDTPVTKHTQDFGGLHRAFSEVAKRSDVIRISLIDDLCKTGTCLGTLNGAPLFFDDDHIRLGTTDYFTGVLAQQYVIGKTSEHED